MEDKQKILKFISNEKLELLTSRISEFNPLKVLGVQDFEIRHSNVLAWLLNPNENHNLDDKFFKKFLLQILTSPVNSETLPENLELIYIYKTRFLDLRVERERDHIDILIISDDKKIVVLIENKIYSGEHGNQLSDYKKKVNDQYPGYIVIPVFLTLDGTVPSDESYLIATYEVVYQVLENLLGMSSHSMQEKVVIFIQHYLVILREKFGMNEDLKKLCKELYLENKEAVDLIYAIGNQVDISESIPQFVSIDENIRVTYAGPKQVWFTIPNIEIEKKMSTGWSGGAIASYWFAQENDKLMLRLEIGPFDDGKQRVRFINEVTNKGHRFNSRAYNEEASYSRIVTTSTKIKDWSDKDEIAEKMIKIYEDKKMRKATDDLIEVVKDFNWST